jgi:Ni/Co efflux regulator RcnB
MKKMMSIVAIALMMAGSMAFACDSCGCKDKAEKEAKKEACCGTCKAEKKCETCTDEKACKPCDKKAEAKKAEASE